MYCKKCGENRLFYNGVSSMCRECWKAKCRQHRRANIEYYREYDRLRAKSPERKESFAEKQRRKRAEMGPAYVRAHNAVARAVISRRLVRPRQCMSCLVACRPQAHHDDHRKPLDVKWLCAACHASRHIELDRMRGGHAEV